MAGEDWLAEHAVTLLGDLGVRKGGDVIDMRVLVGPYVPDMKHRIAVITSVPGPGEQLDGAGTVRGVQVLTRGGPNDSTDAERTARRVHRLIRFAPFPMWVGEVRLISVVSSSDPAILTGGEDDGDRVIYVQTHQFLVAEFDSEELI